LKILEYVILFSSTIFSITSKIVLCTMTLFNSVTLTNEVNSGYLKLSLWWRFIKPANHTFPANLLFWGLHKDELPH
jgi:hypothetical protein